MAVSRSVSSDFFCVGFLAEISEQKAGRHLLLFVVKVASRGLLTSNIKMIVFVPKLLTSNISELVS